MYKKSLRYSCFYVFVYQIEKHQLLNSEAKLWKDSEIRRPAQAHIGRASSPRIWIFYGSWSTCVSTQEMIVLLKWVKNNAQLVQINVCLWGERLGTHLTFDIVHKVVALWLESITSRLLGQDSIKVGPWLKKSKLKVISEWCGIHLHNCIAQTPNITEVAIF